MVHLACTTCEIWGSDDYTRPQKQTFFALPLHWNYQVKVYTWTLSNKLTRNNRRTLHPPQSSVYFEVLVLVAFFVAAAVVAFSNSCPLNNHKLQITIVKFYKKGDLNIWNTLHVCKVRPSNDCTRLTVRAITTIIIIAGTFFG